jgi:subtilase family serine protease
MNPKWFVLPAVAATLVLVAVAAAANGNANYHAVCPAVPVGAAHCHAMVVTDARGNPTASSTPPAGSYGPAQFHTGYSLPTTAPSAQTIAIVDAYDDPNIENDLAVYDRQYGLPSCTTANGCFRKVDQNGGTKYPRSNAGWSLEIALDVETAHEICQNCKILLVEASSNSLANLGAAVNQAAKLGANVISNSYGGSEYSSETSDQNTYFNHPGVAITASSGDGGYGVEFPAASQYVTAVGGTTLKLTSGNAYGSETAWSGAGSGCSAYVAKPSWQTASGCSRRTVADVSADADPNTGAAVYDSVRYQGQLGWFQVGGTSLAAPLVAAVYALAGNAGSVTYGSYPYAHTSSLHDVTSGSNGNCGSYLCTAGTGYDGPTGLGSPNGTGGF